MTTKYRQCRLTMSIPGGTIETTTYLPREHARVGRVLALKDGGVWTSGWRVSLAGELVDEPKDPRQLIRGHRKMTGDSLPKSEDRSRV